MLCGEPDTPLKVPLPTGTSAPHLDLVHVPWAHQTQHAKQHLSRFSCLCTVTAECHYILQRAALSHGVMWTPI